MCVYLELSYKKVLAVAIHKPSCFIILVLMACMMANRIYGNYL